MVIKNCEEYIELDDVADYDKKRALKAWLTTTKYSNMLESIQGLNEIIKTPYMLKIIIDILPSLDTKQKITKAKI